MARYFFNLAGEPDDDAGTEFETFAQARIAAVGFLGAYLQKNPGYVREGHWRVDVTDEAKTLLTKLVVAMVDVQAAPAAIERDG